MSEIFSIKLADTETDVHTETHRHVDNNKGRVKLAAREPTVFVNIKNDSDESQAALGCSRCVDQQGERPVINIMKSACLAWSFPVSAYLIMAIKT